MCQAVSGRDMLQATLLVDIDTEDELSRVSREVGRPFAAMAEEITDDGVITFLIEAGDQFEKFRRRFEAADSITLLESVDETKLLVTKESNGALPIIRSNHGKLNGIDHFCGTKRVFRVLAFRREDVSRMIDELGEVGNARLGRIVSMEDRTATLTPKQREAVTTAFAAGYFEWPRETGAEKLADELGVAHPTFLEHLRKGEQKLLEIALGEWETPEVSVPHEREFLLAGAEL